ncbi:MAG: ISKra4 family transposase [Oligoflexia bacterium]|nr:ISKra4 family transposase [Oligoflexia bacterium]
MKAKVQIVIETEQHDIITTDIINIHRGDLSSATLGLTLQEAKELTSSTQQVMAIYQLKEFLNSNQICPHCNKQRSIKDYGNITYRTLFGKLKLKSPRLNQCICTKEKTKTYSPLVYLLTERTSPELSYLESKWASLMSYGMTTDLLQEVFPLNANISSVFNNARQTANRLEAEIGDEEVFFINGCQREFDELPKPEAPLTVGIDGGYVHAREGKNCKAGWFEVIVGKSLQENKETKRFGFVTTYDKKSKRRLYEMLKGQGLQMNQRITFLSDGGDNVRDLQLYMSPQAEHVLDWFHITMRLTVMNQIVIGWADSNNDKQDVKDHLESIKWCLWHGNVFKALKYVENLTFKLDPDNENKYDNKDKLYKLVNEFYDYINSNSNFIVNYYDRHHYSISREAFNSSDPIF